MSPGEAKAVTVALGVLTEKVEALTLQSKENMTEIKAEIKDMRTKVEEVGVLAYTANDNKKDIEKLEKRINDRSWIGSIVIALGTILGIIFGPKQ